MPSKYAMTIKVADMPEVKAWMEEAREHISALAHHDCADPECCHVADANAFLAGGDDA